MPLAPPKLTSNQVGSIASVFNSIASITLAPLTPAIGDIILFPVSNAAAASPGAASWNLDTINSMPNYDDTDMHIAGCIQGTNSEGSVNTQNWIFNNTGGASDGVSILLSPGVLGSTGVDFLSLSSAGTELIDTDMDTWVRVEETADDDIIRFRFGDNSGNYAVTGQHVRFATSGLLFVPPDAVAGNANGVGISFNASAGNGTGVGGDIDLVPGAGGASDGTVNIQPASTGAGGTGQFRFFELFANGIDSVGFRAPDNIPASLIWTLPATDATIAGQVLSSNASGLLSWVTPAGGSSTELIDADLDTYIRVEATPDSDEIVMRIGDRDNSYAQTDFFVAHFEGGGGAALDILMPDAINTTGDNGIDINVRAGDAEAGESGFGGDVNITAGRGAGGDFGGNVTITAGASHVGDSGEGGVLTLLGGSSDGGADAGNVVITAGTATSGGGGQTIISGGFGDFGGSLTLRSGGGATVNSNIVLDPASNAPNPAGHIDILSGGSISFDTTQLRFYERAANGGNYVAFRAPDDIPFLTGDTVWTLPTADGNANDFLQTDGAGQLSWAAAGGGGGAYTPDGTRAAPNNVVGATGIAHNDDQRMMFFAQGSGGPVTVTANPQIAAGSVVGQEIIVIGRSDTNTIRMTNGNGLELNGAVNLAAAEALSLIWDGTVWTETSRNF